MANRAKWVNLINWPNGIKIAAGIVLGRQLVTWGMRRAVKQSHSSVIKTIMTDPYDENLWEFVSATTRAGPQIIVETNLRSQEGEVIQRPLGSPKKFPSLEDLMFNIAQFHVMPTPIETPIETRVTFGKNRPKPVTLDTPIMISGMAYGEAVTEEVKIALAKGASMAGTAICTGEGPYLPEEHKAANKCYIYQYHRGDWDKTEDILSSADMIEIQFGQGALAGVGHVIPAKQIDSKLRKAFGYPLGKDAVSHSRQPEVNNPRELKGLVRKLRNISSGAPIGAKIGAGKYLEGDLEWLADADVDYIAIDGAGAATKGSAPILQDDFGVPIIFALDRAARWLRDNQVKDKIKLIAAGKIRTPGDMLKALALGADACYIGSMALFALTHTMVLQALPFEPPTQVVWYDGKFTDKFNIDQGATNLAKFIKACTLELEEGVKALGKTAITQVDKEDLFAINELVARGVGVPMAYEPYSTE